MLISDRRLTPPSRPRRTEIVATPVIAPISSTSSRTEFSESFSLPKGMPHSDRVPSAASPEPNSSVSPEAACSAPMPSEVAKPNSVARTASVSTT